MKTRIPHAVAAAIALAAVPVALAQTAQTQPTQAQPTQAQANRAQATQPQTLAANAPSAMNPNQARIDQALASQAQVAPPQPPAGLVSEPIATASRLDGPDGQLAKAIVDAMNADASLKHSKISVQPADGEGRITLSGATLTDAQAKRAGEIATAQAGQGKVTNAILGSDV